MKTVQSTVQSNINPDPAVDLHATQPTTESRIKHYLIDLQQRICTAFETFEPTARFMTDPWERPLGGGGISRVLEGGEVFEKAGVNFSHIFGEQLPSTASTIRPELAGQRFQAFGLSLVIHPRNPYVPTSHMNVRFFCTQKKDASPPSPLIWWFGGGYDLTPCYGFVEDCVHWHRTVKQACDLFGTEIYPEFKQWADDYFYLQHRKEARGIGGIFFDDLNRWDIDTCFKFMQAIGDSYLDAYLPLITRRKDTPYGERERAFQTYRRGRYVEFNLVYDRGTLFGLQSNGRTESILMSLPPEVTWRYNWQPETGSPEAKLYTDFLPTKDWAALIIDE